MAEEFRADLAGLDDGPAIVAYLAGSLQAAGQIIPQP
jgi:hypothetical protein